MSGEKSLGKLLRDARRQLGWSQQELADRFDSAVSRITVGRWEKDEQRPTEQNFKELVGILALDEQAAYTVYYAGGKTPSEIRYLPPHNPLFTGREVYLERLHALLQESSNVALTQPVSLSGLGGIGKTQLALVYAYHAHPKTYRAVFWVNAADATSLQSSYEALARWLELAGSDDNDATKRVQAVKDWLADHTDWLLIMDNADDLSLARSFFPPTTKGHILLTTRSQFVGDIGARQLEIDKMTVADGLLFLLRRSHPAILEMTPDMVAPEVAQAAVELVELLDGHPLALDQAGAYVAETGVSLATYIELYQGNRRDLLERRRAVKSEHGDHPDSVAVTFEISFEKAAEQHPLATDILHFCAFLQPDAIPEELFQYDDAFKAQPLAFHEGIAALRRYSLVKQNTEEKTYSMHRLLLQVVIDMMLPELQKQWRKQVIRALTASFPRKPSLKYSSQRERLLPHVLTCVHSTDEELAPTLEVAILFQRTAMYAGAQKQYSLEEALLERALSIGKQCVGSEHSANITALSELARAYSRQGKCEQAETLLLRARSIIIANFGAEHPLIAENLYNLATVYDVQGNHRQAEACLERALSIHEQHVGTRHPSNVPTLCSQAELYCKQGEYDRAESLYQRALSICKEHLGTQPLTMTELLAIPFDEMPQPVLEPFTVAVQMIGPLEGLSGVMTLQGKHEEAEALQQRVLNALEALYGKTHPFVQNLEEYNAILGQRRSKAHDTEAVDLETADVPPPNP